MDGNRRWAKQRGLPPFEGHRRGYQTMKDIGEACLARGIESLTVYAFSTENWKRTEEEVGFLMGLFEQALKEELSFFMERKIRVRILGRRERLSESLVNIIADAEEQTKDFDRMTFAICLNYGGRLELVDAVKRIVSEEISADAIDESTIAKHLYWSDMPEPDLVIRTSGEERLSNFLLWECAYSELLWSQKHWPDFDETEFDAALQEFATRQRRHGK